MSEGVFRYSFKANRYMGRKDGKPNYSSADNGGSLSIEIGFDDPSEIDKIISDLQQIETRLNPAVFDNFLKNAEKYFIDARAELNDDAAKPPAPQTSQQPPAQGPSYTKDGKYIGGYPKEKLPAAPRGAIQHMQEILMKYMTDHGFKASEYGFSKGVKGADGWTNYYINLREPNMVDGAIQYPDKSKVKAAMLPFSDPFLQVISECQNLINDNTLR